MASPITIMVTDKTNFKVFCALKLGELLHFDGKGIYRHSDGREGDYDQDWLDSMLLRGAFVTVSELAVGDRVELVDSEMYGNWKVGDTGTVIAPAVGSVGKGYFVDMDKKPGSRVYFGAFRLAKLQDDPLPPVPDSVRYHHWNHSGINADAYLDVHSGHFASGPHIRINDKDNRGITIDADTALQLAHDIRRMAMEIKRNQKQEQAQ